MKRTTLSLALTALMLVSTLTGCTQSAVEDALKKFEQYMPEQEVNQTISENSKWINSTIDGTINADTPTSVKDDFYTAVNKDWLLQPLPDGVEDESVFNDIGEQYSEKVEALMAMATDDTTGLDPEVMSASSLIHIQSLVHQLAEAAADTTARDAMGAEPLRPYIETISSIDSMEAMTAYLGSTDGRNPFGLELSDYSLEAPFGQDAVNDYTVLISPTATLALQYKLSYVDIGHGGFGAYKYNQTLLSYVLQKLGYSEAEVRQLLTACYRFERKLARCLPTDNRLMTENYYESNQQVYDREGLAALAGNYPIMTILDALGVGASKTFTVTEPLQLEELGRIYTEKNLADMKAYLIVNTVLAAQDLLDETTSEMAADYERQMAENTSTTKTDSEEGEDTETEDGTEEKGADEDGSAEGSITEPEDVTNPMAVYYRDYVQKYLLDAYQQMYIGHYCTAAAKREIHAMAEELATEFSKVIAESDWMSDETKAAAQEKLSAMGLHILYPDQLIDYSTLSFEGCASLVDMVARIHTFHVAQETRKVNQPCNRSDWNMEAIPTLEINAFYSAMDNSVNLCAALLAGDDLYSETRSYEENLACLGTVLGHEITHGFDTTGYQYDKNGRHYSWWTAEDQYAYDQRANALIRYYSGLSPVSRSTYLSGSTVSGEAIADMGGMKCALGLAAKVADFDYDAFFRAYAVMWRSHRTYIKESMYNSDSHPTGMLRTNVTLMQFDEFEKTYDIGPGDGMYLPADERIMVW